jgi:hypothetical protein
MEELEDIWKEALESRTHEDVPDCVDDGRPMLEASVLEPIVPIKEEPDETSIR